MEVCYRSSTSVMWHSTHRPVSLLCPTVPEASQQPAGPHSLLCWQHMITRLPCSTTTVLGFSTSKQHDAQYKYCTVQVFAYHIAVTAAHCWFASIQPKEREQERQTGQITMLSTPGSCSSPTCDTQCMCIESTLPSWTTAVHLGDC